MLSILFFGLWAVVFGILAYYVLNVIMRAVVYPRVCSYSLSVAQSYLMENGRGFYESKTLEAVFVEAQIRTFLILLLQIAGLALILIFVPSNLVFLSVPQGAIKVGLAGGLAMSSYYAFMESLFTRTLVGRLEMIDRDGKAHFAGVWGENFTLDVSLFWQPENYPAEGAKYMVLEYGVYAAIATLELQEQE